MHCKICNDIVCKIKKTSGRKACSVCYWRIINIVMFKRERAIFAFLRICRLATVWKQTHAVLLQKLQSHWKVCLPWTRQGRKWNWKRNRKWNSNKKVNPWKSSHESYGPPYTCAFFFILSKVASLIIAEIVETRHVLVAFTFNQFEIVIEYYHRLLRMAQSSHRLVLHKGVVYLLKKIRPYQRRRTSMIRNISFAFYVY